jgi:streptogramin lyase
VSSFSPPFLSGERPDSVALGPDGNIWVTTVGLDNVYVMVPDPITLTPAKITLSGAGQSKKFTITESGATAWTASSSNTAVATVAQSSPANTFKVTSVATGKCKIKVTDAAGNSANVSVTVN